MSERIRWEAAPEASSAAWHGYAGTQSTMLFVIYKPVPGGTGTWGLPVLATYLPGMADERLYGDIDQLRDDAERWLEEFVSSLGASFAVTDAARSFAKTWQELLTSGLADGYGCTLNCDEADAAADLYRALGDEKTAAEIIATHAAHDDEGDAHHAGGRP